MSRSPLRATSGTHRTIQRTATTLLTLSLAAALTATHTPASTAAAIDHAPAQQTPTAASTAFTADAAARKAQPKVTAIAVKPTSAITGEKTKITATVTGRATKKTLITFATQRTTNDPTAGEWTTLGTATVKRGKAKITVTAPTEPGNQTYRASLGTSRKALKNAPTAITMIQPQRVNVTYPDAFTTGTGATITVNVSPGRRNQELTLEQNTGGSWKTLDTTTTDLKSGSGRATFTITPPKTDSLTLRVTAESYKGSTTATSTPATIPVTANNGGGGPVGDTVVLTQAASDNITSISTTGQVTFADAALVPTLTKGDLLLVRPTDAAPGGALRQITTTPANATGAYGTTTASLTDAIPDTNGPTTVEFKPVSTDYKMVAAEVVAEPTAGPGDIVGNAIDLDIIRYIPDTSYEDMVEGTWSTSLLPRLTLDTTTNNSTYDLAIDVWEDSQFTHDLTVNDRNPDDGGSSFDQPIGVITRVFQGDLTTPDGTLPIYITLAWDLRMQITSRGADAVMNFQTTFPGDPTGAKVRTLSINGTRTGDTGTVKTQALTRGVTGTIDMNSWTGSGGAKVNNHIKVTPSLFEDTSGTADLGWLYDMNRTNGTCTITAQTAAKDLKPEDGTIAALARKIIGLLPASPTLAVTADNDATTSKAC